MDRSEIDDIYKSANVALIHKGGSIGETKNYRMVGYTSHIIMVKGKIVGKKH